MSRTLSITFARVVAFAVVKTTIPDLVLVLDLAQILAFQLAYLALPLVALVLGPIGHSTQNNWVSSLKGQIFMHEVVYLEVTYFQISQNDLKLNRAQL